MKDLEVYYAGSAKEASALLKEKGDSSWPMGGAQTWKASLGKAFCHSKLIKQYN